MKRIARHALHAKELVVVKVPAAPPALWEADWARRPRLAQDGPEVRPHFLFRRLTPRNTSFHLPDKPLLEIVTDAECLRWRLGFKPNAEFVLLNVFPYEQTHNVELPGIIIVHLRVARTALLVLRAESLGLISVHTKTVWRADRECSRNPCTV